MIFNNFKYALILDVVLFIVSIISLFSFISESSFLSNLKNKGIKVHGIIDSVYVFENIDVKSTVYGVSFKTLDDKVVYIENRNRKFDEEPLYKKGEIVEVIYLQDDPEEGKINSPRELDEIETSSMIVLFISSLLLILCALFNRRVNSYIKIFFINPAIQE